MGSQLSQSVLEEARISIYKINPIVLNRWSPRSITSEKLGYEELMSPFEYHLPGAFDYLQLDIFQNYRTY
jgi:hypothetical protein